MANKKSFVISDSSLLNWLDAHTEDNSRTNGISAITRQLMSLGIVLYDKGFRINENGQLLKQVSSEELTSFMLNVESNNQKDMKKNSDNINKFQKFAHL